MYTETLLRFPVQGTPDCFAGPSHRESQKCLCIPQSSPRCSGMLCERVKSGIVMQTLQALLIAKMEFWAVDGL